jgi:hypothetical protein
MEDKEDSKEVACEMCPLDAAVQKLARFFRRK